MNPTQHWPLNAASFRYRVLLCVSVVAAVLISYLFWIGPGKNSFIKSTSVSAKSWPGNLPVHMPASAPVSVLPEESESREAEFLAYMGDQMFQRGDVIGASEAYHKAIESSPTSERLYLKLALCLSRQNRTGDAINALEEAINIAPDFVQAHHEMGMLLMKKGEYRDAAEHFVEVTKRRPEQSGAFNSLGLALARQGRLEPASNHFARAVQLDGRYVEARFNLAQIYVQMGARERAAAELDRALEINPQFDAARALRHQLTRVEHATSQSRQ